MRAMKEIGGYFGLEKLISREYYPELTAVNTARNGLVYLIRARKIAKLYLPFFLCDSVKNACAEEGVEYELYSIDKSLRPVFNKKPSADEYLYIVNYYGQLGNEELIELKERYGNIIVDNVQAFFQAPVSVVDTIYSCRKFFGVPDGAYVSSEVRLEGLPQDKSKDRLKHLLGRFEDGCASDYYADFKSNDGSFDSLPLCAMSELTHNILGAIDYESARKARERNFAVLHELLGGKNRLNITAPAGAYAYPLYCENGMELKRQLAAKGIYVPTLWPNVLTLDGTLEKELAENILPLPCDQRYDEADMLMLINALTEYINEE